ncbi:MAG: hypothetical protein H0U65_11900 [Rubrobacter sp.]|nr:hypothetical protein [Rubrobacter sp.]
MTIITDVAIAFILVGMVGLHLFQKGNYGLIGHIGFYVFVAGALAEMVGSALVIMAGDAFEWVMIVGFMTVIVGAIFYGAAILRAKLLPLWCGVGFIVAPMLPLILDTYGALLQGLFWVALGYALWSRRSEPAERPSPASPTRQA